MSKISDHEPSHWHDENGQHVAEDARTIPGYIRLLWNAREREYVHHLEAHDMTAKSAQREPEDSPQVSALFDHLDFLERAVKQQRELIAETRRAEKNSQPKVTVRFLEEPEDYRKDYFGDMRESGKPEIQHTEGCHSNWMNGNADPHPCNCGAGE